MLCVLIFILQLCLALFFMLRCFRYDNRIREALKQPTDVKKILGEHMLLLYFLFFLYIGTQIKHSSTTFLIIYVKINVQEHLLKMVLIFKHQHCFDMYHFEFKLLEMWLLSNFSLFCAFFVLHFSVTKAFLKSPGITFMMLLVLHHLPCQQWRKVMNSPQVP